MTWLKNIKLAFFAMSFFCGCVFVLVFLNSDVNRHKKNDAHIKKFNDTQIHIVVESDSGVDQEAVPESIQKYFKVHLRKIPPEIYLYQHNSTFSLREKVVNTYLPPRYRITAKDLCGEEDVPFLLAAVPSVARDVKAREAVRSTWASPVYGSAWPELDRPSLPIVKVVFFFGMSPNRTEESVLEFESKTYGDVVLADFMDSYRNLTLKTLTILHWTRMYCPRARHLLKVDVDTFVNLPTLVDLLTVLSSGVRSYVMGFIYTRAPPRVHRTGPWSVSPDIYAPNQYPYYPVGHSYVVSGDAVQKLLDACPHIPLLEMEDVYVTGILAKTCGVTRINCRLFATRFRNSSKCSLPGGWTISETPCDTQKMHNIWRLIASGECMKKCAYDSREALDDRWTERGELLEW